MTNNIIYDSYAHIKETAIIVPKEMLIRLGIKSSVQEVIHKGHLQRGKERVTQMRKNANKRDRVCPMQTSTATFGIYIQAVISVQHQLQSDSLYCIGSD